MNKTLKIFSYRGINCYIRHTEGRWYELLISYKGGIYGHSLFVEKPHKSEKRITLQERDEGAITELTMAAQMLIENLRVEHSFTGRIKKLITNIQNYGRKTASKFRSTGEAE